MLDPERIRFRHYFDQKNGQLLATIATKRSDGVTMRVSASVVNAEDRHIASKIEGKIRAVNKMDDGDFIEMTEDLSICIDKIRTGEILRQFPGGHSSLRQGVRIRAPKRKTDRHDL